MRAGVFRRPRLLLRKTTQSLVATRPLERPDEHPSLCGAGPKDRCRRLSRELPDVAGCTADGQTLAELVLNARQALASRLRQLADAGESWPEPTPFEGLKIDPG